MISQTLLIVMLITAALLAAYAICWDNPIPFSDLVAITASDVILWGSAILYATGNVVAEEFQKGYMHHDSVIRCSMVKVAN